MTLTINQILVICLILILVVFLVFFGKLALQGVDLLKKIKVMVADGKELADDAKKAVEEVKTSVVSSARSLVAGADTTTKVVAVAATGIIVVSVARRIIRNLFGKTSRRAAKAARKAERDLREAKKAAKRARKIQKEAARVAASVRL